MKIKSIIVQSFMALALCSTIVSCRKETTDNFSPSSEISRSEKLYIPAAIELPDNGPNGNIRVATFFAEGVQKYKAQQVPGSSPATYRWLLVAPQAVLYNTSNTQVGTHTAGPTWQLSATDSIYGQQFYPAKIATPDSNNISWLLLKAKDGKAPTGIFANVSYIQRIATKGGKPPVTAPVNENETVEVKYTAVYRFTKKNQ